MCKSNVCAGGLTSCQPAQCARPVQLSLNLVPPAIATTGIPPKVIPIVTAAPKAPTWDTTPKTVKASTEPQFRYEVWTLRADALSMDYKKKRQGSDERQIRGAAQQLAQNPDYIDVAIEKWNTVTNTMVSSIPVHVH